MTALTGLSPAEPGEETGFRQIEVLLEKIREFPVRSNFLRQTPAMALREDIVFPSLERSRLLAGAPRHDSEHFLVTPPEPPGAEEE